MCPYCGASPHPKDCPEPLCVLDISDPSICNRCPLRTKKSRGWGGRRHGAGAPPGNLNRLRHGRQSKYLKHAIQQLSAEPELRAMLLTVLRITTEGDLPATTRKLIRKYCLTPEQRGKQAYKRFKKGELR